MYEFLPFLGLASLIGAMPVINPRQVSVTNPRRLVTYVGTENDGTGAHIDLTEMITNPSKVTTVLLSSLHLNPDDSEAPHLNSNLLSDPVYAQTWPEVKQLQDAGVKVGVMLGGYGDTSFDLLAQDFDMWYPPLVINVLRQYGLDGIDLDIEKPVDISIPLKLIQSLRRDMGPDFQISMSPVASALESDSGGNLSGFSYASLDALAVDAAGNKLINWYNAQFYSGFADPSTPIPYQTILLRFDPSRVVMGVLDDWDGDGFVGLSTLQATIETLCKDYGNFGGVAGWEYYNAGTHDGVSRWQWYQAIASSMGGTTAV